MKYPFKLSLTVTFFFALAQPLIAQSSGNSKGSETNSKAGTAKNNSDRSGSNRGQGTGTSVGNDSDISGGTTNTGSKNANPKTAKDSRHCASNEDFVKQGDHMICVPRSTNDRGLPMGKEQTESP